MIILEISAGLCNRMRAIASAVTLGNNIKKKVSVIWPVNKSLYCSFFDLFDPIPGLIITEEMPFSYSRGLKIILNRSKKYKNRIFMKNIRERDIDRMKNTDYDYNYLKRYNNIYIKTCHSFMATKNEFNIFKPVDFLSDKIKNTTSQFPNNIIGIHIRRNDNKKSISDSPFELFIEKIDYEIKKDKNVFFYISSDDKKSKMLLKKRYGEKIITKLDVGERDTIMGVQNALVDLYSLSKTKKIIGSYWSSFTETASALSQIPLEIVKSK